MTSPLSGPSLRPLQGPASVSYEPPRGAPVRASALSHHAPSPVDSGEVGLDGVARYLREIDAPQTRRCAAPSCPRTARMYGTRCEACS